jgi:hypothetical protein
MYPCCGYDPGLLVYLEQIESDVPDREISGFEFASIIALTLSIYLSLVFLLQ